MNIINLGDSHIAKSTGYKRCYDFPNNTFYSKIKHENFDFGLFIKNGDSLGLNEDLLTLSENYQKGIAIIDGDIPDNILLKENILYFIAGASMGNIENVVPTFCNPFSAVLTYESLWRNNEFNVNFDDRKIDVGFIGSFKTYDKRRSLLNIKSSYNTQILEVDYWGSSPARREKLFLYYQKKIKNTKITLCPRGFNNSSIRLPESIIFRSIPILIGDETKFYKENIIFPRITFDELDLLDKIIDEILSNQKMYADYIDYIYYNYIQTDLLNTDDFNRIINTLNDKKDLSRYYNTNWRYIHAEFKKFIEH